MQSLYSTRVKYIVTPLLGLLTCGGCHKSSNEAPAPLPMEQIAQTVRRAFGSTDTETSSLLNQYLADLEKNDVPDAFLDLNELSAQTGLTSGQKATLARARVTTSQKLREAAGNGDEHAAQVLHDYISSRRRPEQKPGGAITTLLTVINLNKES